MKSKVLSLNIGHPAPMEWQGRSVVSSMLKSPVAGPLVVHQDRIEGNTFSSPEFHGTIDSVLYAYGMKSIKSFMELLGGAPYSYGAVGETITLEDLDERTVSVGDIFRVGSVVAQATYPRIPCGKVNFRMQHPQGQKAMQQCGRSGIYFKILTPGQIALDDTMERSEEAKVRFSIWDFYQYVVTGTKPDAETMDRIRRNGSVPKKFIEKWQ